MERVLKDYSKYTSANEFMKPTYSISPFITSDLAYNNELIYQDTKCNHKNFFEKTESKYNIDFLSSGRECLDAILEKLNVAEHDIVTIITTTNSLYISGCVTTTVEKYCQWNRNVTSATRVIIVIHEFGKRYENVNALLEHNLPIIEDYAHSFPAIFNCDYFFGDFLLFSLSKFLPLQRGGLLLSKKKYQIDAETCFLAKVAEKTFYHYSNMFEVFFEKRKYIEKLYIKELSSLDFKPFFKYEKFECPGTFVFHCKLELNLLQAMKFFLQAHSVECSVFYGNKAFFLPCHHRMTQFDVEYIVYLIRLFLENNIENK